MRIIFVIAIIASLNFALGFDGPCGGLLEADAGGFQFPHKEVLERGNVCVWIVKLISKQNVLFNLTRLGEGLTVSLYEEHNPSQCQSIEPKRLNSSHVGISVDNNGQTLIVVLTQNGSGQGFAFTWGSLASTDSDLLTAANYINQESDHVLWNRFYNRQKLTLSINADQSKSQEVEINADFRECSLVNHCQCSYIAIYEITTDGHLREVSVACDRPSQMKVQNLLPNVLTFVYLNNLHSVNTDQFVDIKWAISESDVSSTTTSTTAEYSTTLQTSTISTTTDPPISPEPIVTNECGGTVEVGAEETVIEYLLPEGKESMQFCIWTLLPTTAYSGLSIGYMPYGMDTSDVVVIYNWDEEGIIETAQIAPSNTNSTISLSKPYAAIAFSSESGSTSQGFQVTIRGTGHLEGDFNYRGFVLNQTERNFSYPENFGLGNYKPNERVTVVVCNNVTSYTVVRIDFTDIEDDPLIIYNTQRYKFGGTATLAGMTNGSNPEGVPRLTTTSSSPRLFLFHSNDNLNTGKGFSILCL